MNISIIATGKLKEKYLSEAQEYFLGSCRRKNLNTTVFELPDLSMSDSPSEAESLRIKRAEGDQVLKILGKNDLIKKSYIVLLDLQGSKCSTEDFKAIVKNAEKRNRDSLTFIIGGSLGNSEEIKKTAHLLIRMSDMTYPHQLFRIALLETIDRLL